VLANEPANTPQELHASRPFIRGVVAWKVPTEVAEIRGTEERVHESVKKDVAIGMAHEPRWVLDRDTAEHEPARWRETMDIVADARPGHRARAGKPARPFETSSRA
jgi:hypothetical protein